MATRRGFTLIELLVVVALLGVLAALLLAGIGRAKEKARRVTCATNLRQINLGLQMYSVVMASTETSTLSRERKAQ
jgi:prepilin-type N-terminal cleavage/methylation domain-containing protein